MSSVSRVSGLASGIDYESMIEQLMDAQRAPSIKLQQDKQILEWQQEAYRDINNNLRTFRDTVFNMKLQSTYLAKKITISDGSIADVSASSSAVNGTYSFAVEQMAIGASITGKEIGSNANKSTLSEQLGISGTQSITIKVEGQPDPVEFSIDTDTESIYELIDDINNYKPASGTWNVKASYDANLDRVFLTSTKTGAGDIDIEAGELSNALKIATYTNDSVNNPLEAENEPAAQISGQDAIYYFNGVQYTSASNTTTINGITFDIKNISAKDASDNSIPTIVTVNNDTDAVVDAITDFIDQYNSLVETISDKIYEDRDSDYLPLTDDQREQLTDDQIDQWTKKAQTGLLRNDMILSGILSDLRMAMSAVVPNVSGGYIENGQAVFTDRLSKIGITTTDDYMSPKLEINEDQLRAAVEKDPDGVMSMFTSSSDDYDQMGIAMRLYEDVNKGMDRLFDKAGSSSDYNLVDDSFIGKKIQDIDSRLKVWEDRLEQIEDRYYRQFSAMEQAISQLNQQSAWLLQQFGGSSQ